MMTAFYVLILFLILVNGEENTKDYYTTTESDWSCENSSSSCSPPSGSTEAYTFTTDSGTSPVPHQTSTIPIENKTIIPTSKPPTHKKETSKSPEKNCICDITLNRCDMNCCCDVECSEWERASFTGCSAAPAHSYSKCVSSQTLYKNNAPFPTKVVDPGLLCIAKDNFPQRNSYIDQEAIKSIQAFEKVWRRKKRFVWSFRKPLGLRKFEKKDLYKYGDPLWKYINATGEIVNFELPSRGLSSVCGRSRPVSYLRDVSDSCLRPVPMGERECLRDTSLNARNYCHDLVFVSTPAAFNWSSSLEMRDDGEVRVKQELCSKGGCTMVRSLPQPLFAKNSACSNVLMSLHLFIVHNGSQGISEAVCKATLGTPLSSTGSFVQHFRVEFSSLNTNLSTVFHRSGTPGYKDGMPIITSLSKENASHSKSSLTAIGGENCQANIPVLFKENSRIQCLMDIPLNLTSNCTLLDDMIMLELMRGIGRIGTSGDPESWLPPPVPLATPQISTGPPCRPLSDLSLQFVYAYHGPLLSPQAKVLGLLATFHRSRHLSCSKLSCKLRLVTFTSFADASKPVLSKYASAPVVKIKLPKDFFYPFSSQASSTCYSYGNSIFTIFCLFVVYLRK